MKLDVDTVLSAFDAIKDLRDRAERAEALLADERLRVRNLQAELETTRGAMRADDERLADAGRRVGIVAGCDTPEEMADEIERLRAELARRPVVSEETVQWIVDECMPFPAWSPSCRESYANRLRKHLLPSPTPAPEPIPNGVYYDQGYFSFYRCDGLWMGTDFFKKWHARRAEFPQSREEAERRQKIAELPEDPPGPMCVPVGEQRCQLLRENSELSARLRWLNADEVTEPGLYVMRRYDGYGVLRPDEHDIASEHMRLLKGNPRFFRLPDDGGT